MNRPNDLTQTDLTQTDLTRFAHRPLPGSGFFLQSVRRIVDKFSCFIGSYRQRWTVADHIAALGISGISLVYLPVTTSNEINHRPTRLISFFSQDFSISNCPLGFRTHTESLSLNLVWLFLRRFFWRKKE